MLETPAAVAAKLPHLPESPGVYLWKDAEGTVLYVGKAKRLRSRVRSYFTSDHYASVKTQHLVRLIATLDTIVVPSEAHALVLEANLIKEYRPRFNIALRDDKSYPYIKVTLQESFPRVYVTRRLVSDGGRYFGPYTDVGAMRRALNVVKRIFTVRSCHYALLDEVPDRPCLDYHIGKCKAPTRCWTGCGPPFPPWRSKRAPAAAAGSMRQWSAAPTAFGRATASTPSRGSRCNAAFCNC